MAKLKNIVKFLDTYLETEKIKDTSWNGLQIEGKEEINKVVFTENAISDTFRKAIKEKGDLIIVHHGHFWKTGNPSLMGWKKDRLKILLENNISLYASHLPLDRHKTVGNNAQLLRLLGAKIIKEFGVHEGQNISWIGRFEKPVLIKDIANKINSSLNTKSKTLLFGPKKIKTIAVCSGGGGYSILFEAISSKVDLYLTGDTIDVYSTVKDSGFNVIFAGHYATETLGIKALMLVLKKKFKVKTIFIDDPTGL